MAGWLKKKFLDVKEELTSFAPKERRFIVFAMLCGFFICCEYSIIRPVANSLFIHSFAASYFPYAWLLLLPLNFAFVALYNRLIPRWGSKKVFSLFLFAIIAGNVAFASLYRFFPALAFPFYMWKEVYVLLMFQLLWSVIHANIEMKRAKYLYGIFFGIGGLGSLFGSSFPSFFAVSMGSENLLFLTLPVYLCLYIVYSKMCQFAETTAPQVGDKKSGGFLHGMQLIRSSRFLIFTLLIVVFMQMSSALIDFQFNHFLERAFVEKDLRTEFSGRVFSLVHFLTIFFQFVGSYAIVNWMGLKRAHFSIPFALAGSLALFAFLPILPIISLAFVSVKALDFSLFGVIKEMLYVPLASDEKFRAKSIIDVFAYRSSKAFASLFILFFQFFFVDATPLLTGSALVITLVWMLSVAYGLRGFEVAAQAGDSK